MYLKSLELQGFKSFPNRTLIQFERGATVIVGPNGSGKSNISDAMRWVLGEISSRNIRGTKMEDVIFGGTDKRRPMGFAEVSVTFDNTDEKHKIDSPYDEITVTRRYYRAGESEYLINKKNVRLRDIHELFMNTGIGREGYSIIGQGKISEILSKKSEDRRNIFEEAAGISKFRYKKAEAERKLSDTESNMLRITDILSELEGKVASLEKDAEKAKKYLLIYDAKKQADVSMWLYDTKKIQVDLKNAEDNFKLSSNELEMVAEALKTLQTQEERLHNQILTNKLYSEQLLGKIKDYTDAVHNLEKQYQVSESEIYHSGELSRQCAERIEEAKASILSYEAELDKTEKTIDELNLAVESTKSEKEELISKQNEISAKISEIDSFLEEKLSEIKVIEDRLVEYRVRADVLRTIISSDSEQRTAIKLQIEEYTALDKKYEAEVAKGKSDCERLNGNISSVENDLSQLKAREVEVKSRREAENEELGKVRLSKSELVHRAESLKKMDEHFEGYSQSVRFVMQRYSNGEMGKDAVIYGPLSKLIRTDDKYTCAIETALGANIQNIVADNETTVKSAIELLKRNGAGRATFYPVSTMKRSGEPDEMKKLSSCEGFVDRADRLLEYDDRFDGIVGYLLARTAVFDNLDNASRAARAAMYRIRIVTLDGQVINAGGSFTGGSSKRDSGILSRAGEIASLLRRADDIDGDIKARESKLAEIDREIKKISDDIAELEMKREVMFTMLRAGNSSLDSAEVRYESNRKQLEKLLEDVDRLAETNKSAEAESIEVAEKIKTAESEIAALNSIRSKESVTRARAEDQASEISARVNEINITVAETLRDIQSANQKFLEYSTRISDAKASCTEQERRMNEYTLRASQLKAEQAENRSEHEKLKRDLDELYSQRNDVESGNEEYEKRSAELRAAINEKNEYNNLCVITNTKNENKLMQMRAEQDKISTKIWDEYELSYDDAVALNYPPVTEKNHAEIAALQNSYKHKLRAIGSDVKVSSIEEYATEKERMDNLKAQYSDLKKSYDDLIDIVEKIETEMRSSFAETFERVNNNFGVVFSELFGGGQAELSLTDPDDVLTSGIEIKAAPPGKVIKNLALLSGGEQTFVAIALLFAILKVNPSPFCIFDEIESALDEVNVFRFGEYIKKFCVDTQFVLITHRRGTMEIADKLYGVTMPERGVSRILSVSVDEIESKKKELSEDGVF